MKNSGVDFGGKRNKVSMTNELRPRLREEDSLRKFLKSRAREPFGPDGAKTSSNPQVGAYMWFFHSLSDQEKAIEKILSMFHDAEIAKVQAELAYESKKKKLSVDLAAISEETKLSNEAIAQEGIQDAFAATLFVVLNSLLFSMAKRVQNAGGGAMPAKAGRAIGNTSLLELIRAAGNNFRHYEQWLDEPVTDSQQLQNINILKDAGITPPWSRNVCAEVLLLVGWTNTTELTYEVRKLASEIFQAQTGVRL